MPGPRSLPQHAVRAWVLALTALLLWPQHRLGYGLGHDMVFTPRQPLGAAALGVSSAAPRAVPVDALVALAERLVDGAVVGRLALVVPLVLAGLGAAALLGPRNAVTGAGDATAPVRLAGRLAASGFAVWNPYVVERMALGQWALLWGYAALPWIVLAVGRYLDGTGPLYRVVPPLAAASITPTGGLLACGVLAALLVGHARPGAGSARSGRGAGRSRRAASCAAVALALQAPWLVGAALGAAAGVSDPAAVGVFAARAEWGGLPSTLLGLGGVWDADVVPGSREHASALAGVAVLGLAVALAAGTAAARQRLQRTAAGRLGALAACAVVGLVLAAAGSTPGLSAVLRTIVADVPGGGLLRDGQKFLAPLTVLTAVLVGAAVDELARRAGADRVRIGVLVAVAAALPLAVLPDATSAVWPTVSPVHYPSGYAAVAAQLDGGGDVAVVPFQPYRQFTWAGGRISLDPAARLLPGPVVASDQLQVGDRPLAGEDPRAAQVAAVFAAGRDVPRGLAAAGIRWVLVERRTPGDVPPTTGLTRVFGDADVTVFRVPGHVRDVSAAEWRVAVAGSVLGAWVLALAGCGGLAAGAAVRAAGRRRRAGSE